MNKEGNQVNQQRNEQKKKRKKKRKPDEVNLGQDRPTEEEIGNQQRSENGAFEASALARCRRLQFSGTVFAGQWRGAEQ